MAGGGTRADRRTDLDGGHRPAVLAPVVARAVIAGAFCAFAIVAVLWVLHLGAGAGETALAVALLAGLLGVQYLAFGRPGLDLRSAWARAALVVQAALAYLPLAWFGQAWISQPSFVAAGVLMVVRPPVSWIAFVAIVSGIGVAQFQVSGSALDVVYVMVNAATAGLYVYGLTQLARLAAALHAARDELAAAAVAGERLRFARDLHDLLGLSLSAIVPRGELALRMLREHPDRAGQELLDVLATARRALADVRSSARLYRETALEDDPGSLSAMLAASDVELRVDLDHRDLAPDVRAGLAAVLREAVAWFLRQKGDARCEIVLRQQDDAVLVDIITDRSGDRGGFTDLAAAVVRGAGELTTGPTAAGGFQLQVRLPVTGHPAPVPPDPAGELDVPLATPIADRLVVAVFCGLFVQAVIRLSWATGDALDFGANLACLLAALVLQLAHFSRPGARLRSPKGYLLLGLLALVTYLPGTHIEVGLVGFLAGSALLVLPPAFGWGVFALVVGSVAAVQLDTGFHHPRDLGYIAVTANVGLIAFGLTWMARTVRQVRAARAELAVAALAETRLRFAQDLHDLLGLSLSAIALKSELAHRLIGVEPARAAAVVAELVAISRRALAEVRSLAGGYHEMSLVEECRTARELLTTAGLDVRMDVDDGELPPRLATALAAVLREGVTNVLRHSKGESCGIDVRIGVDEVRLHVVNDGVPDAQDHDHPGSGLRNMADRVGAVGGVLSAGVEGDGRFALRACIPLAAERALGEAP
jgi:signal transduction histidine kinase